MDQVNTHIHAHTHTDRQTDRPTVLCSDTVLTLINDTVLDQPSSCCVVSTTVTVAVVTPFPLLELWKYVVKVFVVGE